MDIANLIKRNIRVIPDYPKKGILFQDITILLQQPKLFNIIIQAMAQKYLAPDYPYKIDKIVALEARGFILGAALAYALKSGFVPIRKKGKLPFTTMSQNYDLEYGTAQIEIHCDAINAGENIILIDDIIATGGTMLAAINLVKAQKANIISCDFLLNLANLGGLDLIKQQNIQTNCLLDINA